MMKSVGGKILAIYGLGVLLGSVACENIALVKRPTPELDGDEIVGEITSMDSGLKQIYLRHLQPRFDTDNSISFLAAENIR